MNINKLMGEFDKEFVLELQEDFGLPVRELNATVSDIKSFLRSALSKTCDEILAAVPKMITTELDLDYVAHRNSGFNEAREAIESKVKELKGL